MNENGGTTCTHCTEFRFSFPLDNKYNSTLFQYEFCGIFPVSLFRLIFIYYYYFFFCYPTHTFDLGNRHLYFATATLFFSSSLFIGCVCECMLIGVCVRSTSFLYMCLQCIRIQRWILFLMLWECVHIYLY